MHRPFNIYQSNIDDFIANGNLQEYVSNRDQNNRPKSAPKRPSSANAYSRPPSNPVRNNKVKQTNHAHAGPGVILKPSAGMEPDEHQQRGMTKDDILFELNDTKKKLFAAESQVVRLRTENQRWEKEITKQQHRIDKLLEINNGTSGIDKAMGGGRREPDKALQIRQLKMQINGLRETISSRDAEIEALNRGQKASHLLELITEKDEYLAEIVRLQKVVKDLKDELTVMRQRREWSSNLLIPDDIADAPPMQQQQKPQNNIKGGNGANKPVRPQSGRKKPIVRISADNNSNNNNSSLAVDSSQQQPQSTSHKPIEEYSPATEVTATSSNGNINSNKNNNRGFQAVPNKSFNQQQQPLQESQQPTTVTKTPDNENESSPQPHNPTLLPAPIDPPQGQDGIQSVAKILSEASSQFAEGDVIEGHFRGVEGWYRGRVTKVLGRELYDIEYDDGDKEFEVPAKHIRLPPLGYASPVKPPPGSAPVVQATSVLSSNKAPQYQQQSVDASSTISSAFKVGDSIEARYYNGNTWYAGRVKVVRTATAAQQVANNSKYAYDVDYDDGEMEKNMTEDKLRLPNSATVLVEQQKAQDTSSSIMSPAVPAAAVSTPDNGSIGVPTKASLSASSPQPSPRPGSAATANAPMHASDTITSHHISRNGPRNTISDVYKQDFGDTQEHEETYEVQEDILPATKSTSLVPSSAHQANAAEAVEEIEIEDEIVIPAGHSSSSGPFKAGAASGARMGNDDDNYYEPAEIDDFEYTKNIATAAAVDPLAHQYDSFLNNNDDEDDDDGQKDYGDDFD